MDLLSEGEQWEAFKAWLRTNGPALIGGLVLGGALFFGWRWYQNSQERAALAAATAFETVVAAYDRQDFAAGDAALETLKREHPRSIYAAAGQLAAAKVLVGRNELDAAAAALQPVIGGTEERFSRVARIRLARIQIEQAKYDEALKTLSEGGDPGAYAGAYAHVRGDALYRKGDLEGALREYRLAREEIARNAQDGAPETVALLDLKINDLQAPAS